MSTFLDSNVFMIYAFPHHGLNDPAAILQKAQQNQEMIQCPVIADNAAAAAGLFDQEYKEFMISGVVSLEDLKKTANILEAYREAESSETPDAKSIYTDSNVFLIYAFQKNGQTDPLLIAKNAMQKNQVSQCPVLAADAMMAINLFSGKYPDLMVSGIFSLEDLRQAESVLENFRLTHQS